MTLLILLAILGSYRLAHMIVMERGPFDLILWIRSEVTQRWHGTWMASGINCLYCVSFWTSLLLALLLPWAGVPALLLYWWGIAGAAILIISQIHGDG